MHNDRAVIQGTYADYRRVKGRKVLQLVIEVPIEQAPEVHSIFGEPSPDGSTWVAVALLDPATARTPSTAPEKPASGGNGSGGDKHRLSRQAALCCQDARFRRFLNEHVDVHGQPVPDADAAADVVRWTCGVKSRSEFDTDADAGKRWSDIYGRYIAWREAP